ncbi:S-adenosyl-L-methionine-dependent methyltransferase [Dactylonectria macrodidyma]|uniref:S-adenosyl-L-methionine-dependent methyltransferase n=1 Tax=Dactylonectria macrodidyma TaxID=307937 RepID=A0A9P9FT55_9HYPO|nr:S-adenosyl-L-methionine-dependent methyltransferase [Dactylonectria macrodidyma]
MPGDFDKQSYWRDRFTSEKSFEWLVPSADFIRVVEPQLSSLRPEARILHIGIGTSDLQNHFRARGYSNVLNIDFEPLAVDRGRELEKQSFGDVKMRYGVHDATQLDIGQREKFHLVVDKSTVDAVSCAGKDPLRRMVAGVSDCLAPGGVWISLSYSESRFDIADLPFDVEVLAKFPTPKLKPTDPDIYHWCYLLRPKRDASGQAGAR